MVYIMKDKVAVSFALWIMSAWWFFLGYNIGKYIGK